MLNIPTIFYIARRKRIAPSPPAALTLVAVDYNQNGYAGLVFDRAVNIAGIHVAQFFVNDGGGEVDATLVGSSATLTAANTVRINLAFYGPVTMPETVLNVSANSGIVAMDDGGTWAGANDVMIPFP